MVDTSRMAHYVWVICFNSLILLCFVKSTLKSRIVIVPFIFIYFFCKLEFYLITIFWLWWYLVVSSGQERELLEELASLNKPGSIRTRSSPNTRASPNTQQTGNFCFHVIDLQFCPKTSFFSCLNVYGSMKDG